MVREMKIMGLTMDQKSNTPIVMLKDPKSGAVLPILIGLMEASAITAKLENIAFPRPMTHDLIKNLMSHLGVEIDRVEVSDLRENTFYAWIYLRANNREMKIDARPSDALAIALRTGSPIYVNERVLEKSRVITAEMPKTQEDDLEKWRDILERFTAEDFLDYEI